MEGLRRMFYLRDCVRGVKIPVVILNSVVSVCIVALYVAMVQRVPGFFTMYVMGVVIWVIFAVILNRLKGDPYYSFEFIPTMAVVGVVGAVILVLLIENTPESSRGSDVWSRNLYEATSVGIGALTPLLLVLGVVWTYVTGAIGSAIALFFSGSSTPVGASVGSWAKGVAEDFRGLSDRAATLSVQQGTSSVPRNSPRTSSRIPSLDEGQVTARAIWQNMAGGGSIYCRKCGQKSAIWDAANCCSHCGHVRGVPTPKVECIAGCGAKVGEADKFCFRCGAAQLPPSS